MKKNLFLIFAVLIYIDTIYFSYTNSGLIVDFNYKPFIESFKFDNGIMIFCIALYSTIGTILLMNYFIEIKNIKLKKVLKESEKSALETEEKSDKVKLLEEKIKTLERALKNSLENN